MVGVQVVSIKGDAGVSSNDLDESEVAELFGKTSGFKAADKPVDIADPPNDEEEDF